MWKAYQEILLAMQRVKLAANHSCGNRLSRLATVNFVELSFSQGGLIASGLQIIWHETERAKATGHKPDTCRYRSGTAQAPVALEPAWP